jgi:hypothetical protein
MARAVERPVVIGAAQPAIDHLPDREIGAEMRAPGALHHRLARRIAPRDDPRAEEIAADHVAGRQLARQADRVPRAMEAPPRSGIVLLGQAALRTHDTHGALRRIVVLLSTVDHFWYRLVPESRGSICRPPQENAACHPAPLDALPPRRRAILIAAVNVLGEQGYARASTLEIASRARVSKRELYAEFAASAASSKP